MTYHRARMMMTICGLVLTLSAATATADDDSEIPFDEAFIFFELNDTDGDLGIHSKIDGGPWKRLSIERDANDKKLLDIRVKSKLRRQGLTELFFESAEPTFDELAPERFFGRFPEGEYEVEGLSLDGDELESEVALSHLLPAPPKPKVNGMQAASDCDAELPVVSATEPVVLSWPAVSRSHPELGRTDQPIEVINYEVVVEIDETPYKVSAILPPDAREFVVPGEILALSDEVKFEILVRESTYNQTAVESCFEIE